MLIFLPPSEDLLPALAAYRRTCLDYTDDMDGSAGLGLSALNAAVERAVGTNILR